MKNTLWLEWDRYEVSEQIKQGLENYLFYGIEPGGFLTAVICNDLSNAVRRGDFHNRKDQSLHSLISFMDHKLPSGCWGSRQAYKEWMADEDGDRTRYFENWEKKKMWETLNN